MFKAKSNTSLGHQGIRKGNINIMGIWSSRKCKGEQMREVLWNSMYFNL